MYLFEFPYKITKVKNEKKKRIINHMASYNQYNTKITTKNLCSTYLTCTQLDYMKKMTKNDNFKIHRTLQKYEIVTSTSSWFRSLNHLEEA